MTVKVFSWGKLIGGTSGGGAIIPAEASYGPPEQFTGILPIGDTVITFTQQTKYVTVINADDTDSFQVSFDGGTAWLTIGPYGSIPSPVAVDSIILRSASAGVDYRVVAALQSA